MKPFWISIGVKLLIEFWFLFIRAKIIVPPETEKLLAEKRGFILAGFHNQIMSLTYHCSKYLGKKRKIKLTPLVSQSKDGEMIYQTFLRFQMYSERGSTSKGGAAAFRALLKRIKDGWVPIFTPDGPRGPLYKVQPGVISLAAATGLPIVHFFSVFDRAYQTRSWDKMRLPKFGAKQWIEYSQPFYVPRKLSEEELEETMARLEREMMQQVDRLETLVMSKT